MHGWMVNAFSRVSFNPAWLPILPVLGELNSSSTWYVVIMILVVSSSQHKQSAKHSTVLVVAMKSCYQCDGYYYIIQVFIYLDAHILLSHTKMFETYTYGKIIVEIDRSIPAATWQ